MASKLRQKHFPLIQRLRSDEVDAAATIKLYGREVRGFIDTFPIFTPQGEYNPHYKGKIRKVFVAATLRGLIEDVHGGIRGTTYDCNCVKVWRPSALEGMYLGDNHFQHDRVLRTGTVAEAGKLPDAEREEFVRRMECISFVRARVEQMFSPSGLRRFKRLKQWSSRVDPSLQEDLVVVLAAAYNFDVLRLNGPAQRFHAMDEAWSTLLQMHLEDPSTVTKRKVRQHLIAKRKKAQERQVLREAKKEQAPPQKKRSSREEISLAARATEEARMARLMGPPLEEPGPPIPVPKVEPRQCKCPTRRVGQRGPHSKNCPLSSRYKS